MTKLSEDQQIEISSLSRRHKWKKINSLLENGLSPDEPILDDSTVFGTIFRVYANLCFDIAPPHSMPVELDNLVKSLILKINSINFDLSDKVSFQGALLYSTLDKDIITELYQRYPLKLDVKHGIYYPALAQLFISSALLERKKWALELLNKHYSKELTPQALGMVIPNHFICGQQLCLWTWEKDLESIAVFGDTSRHGEKFTQDVELLLSYGADINAISDEESHTAVMRAAMTWMPEALEFLISKGADVNLANKMGHTALMYVSGYLPDASPMNEKWKQRPEHLQIAKMLVDAGADISLKNKRGDTALDLARKNKNKAVFKYLDSV